MKARALLAVGVLLAMAPIAGCLSGERVREDIAATRTKGAVVAGAPFVEQQGTEDCGATAAAVVLAHAGRPAGRDELEREMVRPSVGGSFTFDVALAVRRRGLHVWEGRGLEVDDLRAWVRAGRPPIVLLGVAPYELGLKHFAVVTGFDDGRGLLLLHDGVRADALYEADDFLERWDRTGRWALVAVPAEIALPQGFALLDARDRARLGYAAERAGHVLPAIDHYRAAVALEPSFFTARANLGRLLLVSGRAADAERELREAAILAPHDVRVRNNLACALLAQAACAPEGPVRDAWLAEAESLARAAVRAAPPALVAICRDTLERTFAERHRLDAGASIGRGP